MYLVGVRVFGTSAIHCQTADNNYNCFHIELKKNVGPVTDCNIFSSYFSCFGLSADTSGFKVNDGSSLLYQVFRIIMTPMNSSRRG